MTRYVAAVDQGTTSTRFMVFGRRGEIIASEQTEHRQVYPKPGWIEHDPVEIWQNTLRVIETTLRRAHLETSDLAAVGITNQRETTVLWNRHSGKPLHNALVWEDTRVDGIIPSSQVYGEAAVAALKGVKLAGILGDQQAALVGQTCFKPGEAKNTYGRGCFVLMNTGVDPAPSRSGPVTTVAYAFERSPPCYALEGSIAKRRRPQMEPEQRRAASIVAGRRPSTAHWSGSTEPLTDTGKN